MRQRPRRRRSRPRCRRRTRRHTGNGRAKSRPHRRRYDRRDRPPRDSGGEGDLAGGVDDAAALDPVDVLGPRLPRPARHKPSQLPPRQTQVAGAVLPSPSSGLPLAWPARGLSAVVILSPLALLAPPRLPRPTPLQAAVCAGKEAACRLGPAPSAVCGHPSHSRAGRVPSAAALDEGDAAAVSRRAPRRVSCFSACAPGALLSVCAPGATIRVLPCEDVCALQTRRYCVSCHCGVSDVRAIGSGLC